MTDETPAPSQGNETPTPQAPPEGQVPPNTELPPNTETPPQGPEGEQAAPVERVVPAADGYQMEEGTPGQLGQIFNKLDMTQEQATGVMKLDAARRNAEAAALRQAGEAHIKTWGDAAETNINLAKRGMAHFDPTGQLKDMLNQTGLGNDPRILEMFYQFGTRMEEGGFLPTEVNTPGQQPKDVAHMWYPDDAPGGKNNGYKS